MMIARVYLQGTSDSRTYAIQAEYWLDYAHRLAESPIFEKSYSNAPEAAQAMIFQEVEHNLKRIQSLKAAILIDKGKKDEALRLLTKLCDEDYLSLRMAVLKMYTRMKLILTFWC